MKVQNSQYNVLFGSPDLELKINGTGITSFILSNNSYVMLIKDLQKAIGYEGKSETWLLELLQSISRFHSIADTLLKALENPIISIYRNSSDTEIKLKTIDVINFSSILEAIINAKDEGYLNMSQLRFAKTSEQLFKALQASDIYALVDASTGFNFHKKTAINKLQKYLTDKSGDLVMEWIKTLPDSFFEVLFDLFNYNWIKFYQNTQDFGQIFNDVIFSRMSNELLDSLRNTKPKRNYTSKKRIDLQHPSFKAFTTELLVLIEKAAGNKNIFLQLLNRVYPKNNLWILKDYHFSGNTQKDIPLSDFNTVLQKSIFINKSFITKKRA